MCRASRRCSDGVPPLGLVTQCITRPFPRYSIRRRSRRLTCRQRRGRRRYKFAATMSDGEAVSHAVNGGDAVVTPAGGTPRSTTEAAGGTPRGPPDCETPSLQSHEPLGVVVEDILQLRIVQPA